MPVASTMLDRGSSHTIEKDSRGGRVQQGGDPILQFSREPSPLEEVKNALPPDQVKSLADVKLENEGWSFAFVEPPREVTHVHEVVRMLLLLMKAL